MSCCRLSIYIILCYVILYNVILYNVIAYNVMYVIYVYVMCVIYVCVMLCDTSAIFLNLTWGSARLQYVSSMASGHPIWRAESQVSFKRTQCYIVLRRGRSEEVACLPEVPDGQDVLLLFKTILSRMCFFWCIYLLYCIYIYISTYISLSIYLSVGIISPCGLSGGWRGRRAASRGGSGCAGGSPILYHASRRGFECYRCSPILYHMSPIFFDFNNFFFSRSRPNQRKVQSRETQGGSPISYHIMLCCTILYYTMLYHSILCYTSTYNSNYDYNYTIIQWNTKCLETDLSSGSRVMLCVPSKWQYVCTVKPLRWCDVWETTHEPPKAWQQQQRVCNVGNTWATCWALDTSRRRRASR